MSDTRVKSPLGQWVDAIGDKSGAAYVAGRIYKSPVIKVPGIGAASAYAAADAFGTKVVINGLPNQGTISDVIFIDKDDEGIVKELVLFDHDFTGTADNSAFAPTDADLENLVGVVSISNFYNYSVNQVGRATPALFYSTDPRSPGRLYGQFVTRGADNIAAGSEPLFFLVVVD